MSGLVSAAILFLLASGLSLIFGVCRVLNLAHGAFFMLATFLAYMFTTCLVESEWNFWLTLILVPVLVGSAGARLRWFYFGDYIGFAFRFSTANYCAHIHHQRRRAHDLGTRAACRADAGDVWRANQHLRGPYSHPTTSRLLYRAY